MENDGFMENFAMLTWGRIWEMSYKTVTWEGGKEVRKSSSKTYCKAGLMNGSVATNEVKAYSRRKHFCFLMHFPLEFSPGQKGLDLPLFDKLDRSFMRIRLPF